MRSGNLVEPKHQRGAVAPRRSQGAQLSARSARLYKKPIRRASLKSQSIQGPLVPRGPKAQGMIHTHIGGGDGHKGRNLRSRID
jgi:hypothetical protein